MAVTGDDLRLLTGSTRTNEQLALFLTMGQLVPDKFLAGQDIDQEVLDAIALYCAGHFYVMSVESGGVTFIKTGQSEERYKSFGYDAHGFMTSRFGQMACVLDPTGILREYSNKDMVAFDVETYSALGSARTATTEVEP